MTEINFATATPAQLAAAGFSFKKCRGQKGPKHSLLGVKGRNSGVNRKGQVAAPVGKMNSAELDQGRPMRAR